MCNLNPNTRNFIQENVFENGVCKMAVILSRPECVNGYHQLWYQPSDLCIDVCHTDITRHILSLSPYTLPRNGILCIRIDVKGTTPRYKLNNDFIDVIAIHTQGRISWCQWKYGCLSNPLHRVVWQLWVWLDRDKSKHMEAMIEHSINNFSLTLWGLDKMAAILPTTFYYTILGFDNSYFTEVCCLGGN